MKNRISIACDGINATAEIKVGASKVGIWILGGLVTLAISVYFFILTQIEPEEFFSFLLFVLIFPIVCIGFPARYFLWNLYGQELLIVNAKSISWSYDYGFFKTNLKTVKYNILGTGFEIIQGSPDGNLGRLFFHNIREEDHLPELIHQTTILLTEDEANDFNLRISEIFVNEFLDEYKFLPFSEN